MLRVLKSLRAACRAFTCKSGNVSIIAAFSMIPLVGVVGLGVDYGVALSNKTKLDKAADVAALTAVVAAKQYVANNQSDPNVTNNAINGGLAKAPQIFSSNVGGLAFTATPIPTITLTFTNPTFTATVSYATTITNHFGPLFNQPTIKLGGTASASASVPSYLDFYLVLDVSGSMGLPATTDGQTYLSNNNAGCQFACHFPGTNGNGFKFAVNHNIQLRSGAVNSAVCGLLNLAAQPSVQNQYRVGLYPFITQVDTLATITTDISSLKSTADCYSSQPMTFTNLLDTGSTQLNDYGDPTSGIGSGGTHFETTFATVPNYVLHYGTGSSSATSRPFIFLVTDGMQNSQRYSSTLNGATGYPGSPSTYSKWGAANFTGSSPAAMSYSNCNALKTSGATISVLYIPYLTLPIGTSNQGETIATNNAIPNLPNALQKCASSAAYFYTANTPADINNALQAMFQQAVQVAHLTK